MLPTEITLCYISGDVHQKWECDLFTSQLENLQYPFFTYKPQSTFLRILCILVVPNSIITQMIRKYFQLQEHFIFTHTSVTLLLLVFLFACLPNASYPSISSSDDTSSVYTNTHQTAFKINAHSQVVFMSSMLSLLFYYHVL